ncbi:hypothetical protein ACFSGX_00395 [Sphingomonas arantia]|uniref:Uncharacterized protein n=1 Tax=Sphingomonas arantia TaxID=1460676 RepID=A0ABW4TTH0_9SPHN
MNPVYTRVAIDYAPMDATKVFVKDASTFSASSLLKQRDPKSNRLHHFKRELVRLSEAVGSPRVPVFVQWPNAGRLRMDKGCLAQALESGFILDLTNGDGGFVSHVELAESKDS